MYMNIYVYDSVTFPELLCTCRWTYTCQLRKKCINDYLVRSMENIGLA